MTNNVTIIHNVEILKENGIMLICKVGEREIIVPRSIMKANSAVIKVGYHGALGLPEWFAHKMGLAD